MKYLNLLSHFSRVQQQHICQFSIYLVNLLQSEKIVSNKMGNSQQIIYTKSLLVDLKEWKQIGMHRQTSKIVQHRGSNMLGELQSILVNPKNSLLKQMEIYQYRKQESTALVSCLGVVHEKISSSSICSSTHLFKVLTERIPFRLNQLPQLTFSQSLYVLVESLRGYSDCFSKLGAFDINGEMIGVNNQGEIKVWVNQNFALNHPILDKPQLQTSYTKGYKDNLRNSKEQTQMVDYILKLVQQKCQLGCFPTQFKQIIYRTPLTFYQAFEEIQNFVKLKDIFVPDSILNSIPDSNKMIRRTASSQNFYQRTTFEELNSPVSIKLTKGTQPQIQRIYSPAHCRSNQQLISHFPKKITFKRPHENVYTQSSIYLVTQDDFSRPIQSKMHFNIHPHKINSKVFQTNYAKN